MFFKVKYKREYREYEKIRNIYVLIVMEISKKEKLQTLLEQEQIILDILLENKEYVKSYLIRLQKNIVKAIRKEMVNE